MKKVLILLFVVSILLQSCYSYKTINKDKTILNEGEIYKIKQDNYFEKVTLLSSNDSILTVKVGRDEEKITKSSILEIKEREFSVGKSVLLSVLSTTFIVGMVTLVKAFKNVSQTPNR